MSIYMDSFGQLLYTPPQPYTTYMAYPVYDHGSYGNGHLVQNYPQQTNFLPVATMPALDNFPDHGCPPPAPRNYSKAHNQQTTSSSETRNQRVAQQEVTHTQDQHQQAPRPRPAHQQLAPRPVEQLAPPQAEYQAAAPPPIAGQVIAQPGSNVTIHYYFPPPQHQTQYPNRW